MRMSRRMGLLGGIGLLNDTSWEEIKRISDAGKAANYWSVGDSKEVILNGTVGALTFSNYLTYVFIIGFDHNSTYEGTNRIHFQFAKTALNSETDICFVDSNYAYTGSTAGFRMNTSNTNIGGWSSSYMRNTICGTSLVNYSGSFIGVLPSDLRAVLKSVTKYTDNTGNASTAAANVTATTDYIFLPAEYEVLGSAIYANENEASKQARYAYYSGGYRSRKYQHSATSDMANWWVRSPRKHYGDEFVRIYADAQGNRASYSFGFAPCFCV